MATPHDLTARQVFEQFLRAPQHGARALVPVRFHPTLDELLVAYDKRDADTGLPTFREILVSLPKKWGKSFGGAGLALADLVGNTSEHDREVILIASDLQQSRDLMFASAVRFVRRSDWLSKHVRVLRNELLYREKVGGHIEDHVLRALPARDAKSLHGSNATLTLIDELWTQADYELLEALAPSASRRAPRLVYFSYAGLRHQAHEGCPLWDLLERGQRGDPTLYVLHRAGESAVRDHPFASRAFLDQQRRQFAAVPAKFKRLWLNEWVTSDEGTFLSADEIRDAVDPTWCEPAAPAPGIAYHIGVDLGISNDLAAVVVSHVSAVDRKLTIDAVRWWRGSRSHPVSLITVEDEIVTLAKKFGAATITLDQWQAVHLAERLRTQTTSRIDTVVCDPARLDRHATLLKSAFSGRHMRIPSHPLLVEQLETIVGSETKRRDKVRFTTAAGTSHHDDVVVALCLSAERDAAAIGWYRLPAMKRCYVEVHQGRPVSCYLWESDAGAVALDPGICRECVGHVAVTDAYAAYLATGGAPVGVRVFYSGRFVASEFIKQRRVEPAFQRGLAAQGLS